MFGTTAKRVILDFLINFLSLKNFWFIILFVFYALFNNAQQLAYDSSVYRNLMLKYNKFKEDDREKALLAADEIEKLSMQRNEKFYRSDALVRKAILYYFDNDFDTSVYLLNKALPLARESKNYVMQMRAFNLLGAISYNKGDFVETEKMYNKKIELAQRLNDTANVFGTYYNLGLVYMQQGNYLKTAEYNFKVLPYFEKKKDTVSILFSLQAVGFAYSQLEDLPSSLKFYRKAYSLARLSKDKYQQNGLCIDISSSFAALNRIDSALFYVDLALKNSVKHNDLFHKVLALDHKAGLYILQQNYSQALSLAKEAYAINVKGDKKPAISEDCSIISQAFSGLKMHDSAIFYAKKAYTLSNELNKSLVLKEVVKVLSTAYENKKMSDSALKYFKIYISVNDSLKKSSQLRGMAQKELYIEKNMQEQLRTKEKLISDTKIEKQRQIITIVFISSILMIIFILIGIINYRQKQKANALVLYQKVLLEEKNKQVTDSINYASRIQQSLMPSEKYIERSLKKLNHTKTNADKNV
jgi:tetratricopeptide (TPR) repeat protein